MSHPKTTGRELALQYLYMVDVTQGSNVKNFADHFAMEDEHPDETSAAFARELVEGVTGHREELDAEIASVAENWNVRRMAAVERNIIRLGIAEMTIHPETSHKIIINEAVELAKKYSSEDAGSFVNGLLDKIRVKIRPGVQ